MRDLALGMKGTDVLGWQSFLRRKGYVECPASGEFCRETDRTTRTFQAAFGIGVDGIVGPVTMDLATRLEVRSPLKEASKTAYQRLLADELIED